MGKPSDIVLQDKNYQLLAEDFLVHRQLLGYHEQGTRASYSCLCEFLHYLEQNNKLVLQNIQAADLVHYHKHLSQRPNKVFSGILSSKSITHHLRAIRHFFTHLHEQGDLPQNPCSSLSLGLPSNNSSTRTALTIPEIQSIYAVTQSAHERAILALAYGCGLRAGELEACNISDVQLRDKTLLVPKGKGTKKRIIPLSQGVIDDLSAYFYDERPFLTHLHMYRSTDHAFLLNFVGGRMRTWTANYSLRAMIERTDNQELIQKQVSLHTLRHSIASHLLERGLSIYQVRLFLGHTMLETTQIYTHISKQQLKDLI